jgi:hypothetical protein
VAPPEAGTCAACIAFLFDGGDPAASTGRCRWRPELGTVSRTLPRCPRYHERGTGASWKPPPVARPRANRGRDREEVFVQTPRAYGPTIDLGGDDVDTNALKALIRDVLAEDGVLGETAIGKRWEGGVMILKPGVEGQQSKEVPIEAFFHKIVMLRDRLRVLEQRINAHDKLSDAEKVEMQQYVTRCYGSLTTFNVLFRNKEDQFVGAKGD